VAAANASTDLGCDYWGLSMPNELDATFLGNSSNGTLGTLPSEFGFVVVNPGQTAANVQVTNAHISAVNVTVAALSSQSIQVPWLPICGTGRKDTAFHLTSDQPVTAYQFNPIASSIPTGTTTCAVDTDCNPSGSTAYVCLNSRCVSYAYTADASLLLPTSQLGAEYVAMAYDHIDVTATFSTAQPLPALMAVLATEDGTHVHVDFAGATAASASSLSTSCNVASGSEPGHGQTGPESADYVLAAGEVLQFASDKTSAAGTCATSIGNQGTVCRYPSDLTGSLVTSTPDGAGVRHPIAVFSGAGCTYVPYNQVACDHMEEALTPYRTWGKTFVGVKSHSYAGATMAVSDTWRLVAGCGAASCPNGTTVTITPQISGLRTRLVTPCSTSNGVTTCTLPPLQAGQTAPWLEFNLGSAFTLVATQPVQLAQYFTSESASGLDSTGASTATEGDPSLVLAPPVEQWRANYRVLAPNTYAHNYLNLTAEGDGSGCPTCSGVQVDGASVPSGEWANIPGTTRYAAVHALCGGTSCVPSHTISAPAPVGVVVYGYDSYVSYGYPGGMNLATLQTTALGQ
jgi:hypothetical protein